MKTSLFSISFIVDAKNLWAGQLSYDQQKFFVLFSGQPMEATEVGGGVVPTRVTVDVSMLFPCLWCRKDYQTTRSSQQEDCGQNKIRYEGRRFLIE